MFGCEKQHCGAQQRSEVFLLSPHKQALVPGCSMLQAVDKEMQDILKQALSLSEVCK